MERISIAQFAQSKGFISTNKVVGFNSNSYPYITFIDANNKAENIYFSKGASEDIIEGQVIDADFLSGFEVSDVTNADGEVRTKLVRKGGNRFDLTALWS